MSKELRIGLVALIAGALLYYGFNYLKGTDVFANTNRYYVEYANTDGLVVGSSVKINGVQVGRVSSVSFQPEKNNVLVEVNLQANIELGDSTVADLANDGLLGGKAIVLKRKTVNGLLEAGDYLIPEVDKSLFDQAQPTLDNIQVTITRVNSILEGMQGFGDDLKLTFKRLDTVLLGVNRVLTENDQKIDSAFTRMDDMIAGINESLVPLNATLENMQAVSDSLKNSELKATIATSNELLKNVNKTLDSLTNEKGTVGKLIANDSLYQNLNQVLVDLDKLLIHFNNYPRDFMKPLGRKHKKLEGLEEEE